MTRNSAAWLRDRMGALRLGGRAARLLLLRRVAAVLLLALAAIAAMRAGHGPAERTVPVLVAAADLEPGHVLDPDDLVLREMPADLVPTGALHEHRSAAGHVLATGAGRGEPLTSLRLAGPSPPGGLASVPIRLADPEVAEFVRPGRRVDIVTSGTDGGGAHVLAERAPVLTVPPDASSTDQDRLIVVGLPAAEAAEVAATALTRSVTVTLR
ncbi:SAF domain-containing protein [Saccharopolyspora cebuensis]|uniref:SAF domain-containing protein n=1 Tax=Saccharopolyspora cebuensis TaxID=418759 RepID=A0ABV4CJ90_9PSEU